MHVTKRILDLFFGGVIFVPILPILIVLGIWIRLDSKGPVFFKQDRIGKDGQVFVMYKLRSMVDKAETMGTGMFSYEDDPRITRAGHFIRRMSLDELPQILNVLRGNMSLVGPRPPLTYELGPFEEFSPELRSRFDIKPGITGLAQVSGRNELDWDKKLVFDLRYIKNFERRGVFEDLRILLLTIKVVASMSDTIEKRKEDV